MSWGLMAVWVRLILRDPHSAIKWTCFLCRVHIAGHSTYLGSCVNCHDIRFSRRVCLSQRTWRYIDELCYSPSISRGEFLCRRCSDISDVYLEYDWVGRSYIGVQVSYSPKFNLWISLIIFYRNGYGFKTLYYWIPYWKVPVVLHTIVTMKDEKISVRWCLM